MSPAAGSPCPAKPALYTLPSLTDLERCSRCHACAILPAAVTVGRSPFRGKAKYLGGIGLKVTSITKRKFKPNLQDVTALIDGHPQRIKVSTRAIKQGLVVKPLKRKYGYTRQQSRRRPHDVQRAE